MSDPQADPLSHLSRRLADLAARAAAPVVGVQSGHRLASGFVWREGLVVTADEALDSDDIHVHLAEGGRVAATLLGRDPSTDVALLRVEAPLPAPAPLDAGLPVLGALALALGRGPDGPVVALGAVGAVGPAWRSLRGGRIDARLGLDLRLPRAAEGGLALDAEGRAFGMAVLGPRQTVLAIPAATIERVAPRLLSHGRMARGYLGLGLQPLRLDATGEPGAIVVSVDPDGPGRRAGLLQGDILARVGDAPLSSLRDLLARLGPDSVGQALDLLVLRGGEARPLSLTIGEQPLP